MVLNYIWIAFFLIAFVVALCKLVIGGDTEVFTHIINASFASAKTGFEISLGLTGVLALWLGIMKIGEKGGVIQAFARLTAPVFSKLFPGIPKDHPATGSIFMCISANLLGLDNAATPMGLKAMKELQELNTQKDSASDPMIMFLCINASGLTLIPVSIMTYRAQMGAANPADVFLPLMLATFSSTLVAILAVCFKQRINILQRNLLLFFGGMIAFIGGLALLFGMMSQQSVSLYSTLFANILLFSIICGFIISGIRKKINVYDTFIEGAKEGFQTAVTIIPYLIAVLVAIAVFRASGAMDFLIDRIVGARTARIAKAHMLGSRAGHAVCGRSAYHADETAQRQRGAGYDAGCDEHLRRGFVHRPPLFHRAGIERHDFLRRRPLFRQCRNPQHLLYDPLFATGRFSRGGGSGHYDVSVFYLISK